jgi:hypothetical protein
MRPRVTDRRGFLVRYCVQSENEEAELRLLVGTSKCRGGGMAELSGEWLVASGEREIRRGNAGDRGRGRNVGRWEHGNVEAAGRRRVRVCVATVSPWRIW